MSARSLTLDQYQDPPNRSQDPAFLELQKKEGEYRRSHEPNFLLLRSTFLRLAAENGKEGTTAEDVLEAAGGRSNFPKNLIGVVTGHLRLTHAICVIGRRKSEHPEAKGRWVNRFMLNSEAIRVDE